MSPLSREYAKIFNRGPAAIQDQRPETDMMFMKWLSSREEVLYKCGVRDTEQRELTSASQAVEILNGPLGAIKRSILQELLFRGVSGELIDFTPTESTTSIPSFLMKPFSWCDL